MDPKFKQVYQQILGTTTKATALVEEGLTLTITLISGETMEKTYPNRTALIHDKMVILRVSPKATSRLIR